MQSAPARIIHDTTILQPTDTGMSTLSHHSVVLEGDRVASLGPANGFADRLSRGEFADVIDGRGCIVLPGLINTHHHLYQSLTRCRCDVQDVPLFDWLRRLYRAWQQVDFTAANLAAQVSISELLLRGCTTTSDHHYLFPPDSDLRIEAVIEAASLLGIRLHLARGAMTLGQRDGGLPPDELVETDAHALADCRRALETFHDPRPHAMCRIDLAPCSPFNVTPELMRETRDLARAHGALLHTHLAETLDEERFCIDRYGVRPVQYLADLDWLGRDVYLAHCVYLNDEEIARFAQSGTAVSHNPASNFRLGSGIAPLERLLEAGVPVGLGVDGSSSNDGGNLLEAARLAVFGARVRTAMRDTSDGSLRGSLFPAERALHLATRGGATCLRRDELGHLAPGAAADVAMFRNDDIELAGAAVQDPVAALVLCNAPRANRVIIAGRDVVRDGRLVAVDEADLAARFNSLVAGKFRA